MLIELNEFKTQDLIKNNFINHLGYTGGMNVYVMPMNYRLNENSIICYLIEGKKIDIMRNNRSVCVEIN